MRVDTQMTPITLSSSAQLWLGFSRNWLVFLGRPCTGRHGKAPFRFMDPLGVVADGEEIVFRQAAHRPHPGHPVWHTQGGPQACP